jgi:hypothetical protein
MKKVFWVLAVLSLVLAFYGVSRVEADTASFSLITANFYGNGYSVPQSFGYVFTPTTNIEVTSLGFFDYSGTGLGESHEVGIFNSSGTLLTSTTIPAGTGGTLEDRFRYIGITPLELYAGQTYTAAALLTTATDDIVGYANVSGISVNPAISLPSFPARYIFTSTAVLTLPTQTALASADMYIGPNFQLVPLPPSVWLLGSGLLGLAGLRRLRKG